MQIQNTTATIISSSYTNFIQVFQNITSTLNSAPFIVSSNTNFKQGGSTTTIPNLNATFFNATYVSNCTVSSLMLVSFLTVGSNVLVHAGAYSAMFIYLNSKLLKIKS